MKIGVLTSGGDAPGMNAAIRAVVKASMKKGFECYGVFRGYDGLIDGEVERIDSRFVSGSIQRGGTILQTARCPRFLTEEGQEKACTVAKTFGLDALVCIGGDGTMRGAIDLAKGGVNVMFIPATIDNDVAYTDYTIGFDSAVNTALEAIGKVRDTTAAHDRSVVIEVMGRHCGDIALAAGMSGGAEKILVPGDTVDINEIAREIIVGQQHGRKHYIVIKAEGVDYDTAKLAKDIEAASGHECKSIALSYIQRGGSPTASDRILGSLFGVKAVELIADGFTNRAVGEVGREIINLPIEEALNSPAKEPVVDIEICNIIA